jgi:hypothetical protein
MEKRDPLIIKVESNIWDMDKKPHAKKCLAIIFVIEGQFRANTLSAEDAVNHELFQISILAFSVFSIGSGAYEDTDRRDGCPVVDRYRAKSEGAEYHDCAVFSAIRLTF